MSTETKDCPICTNKSVINRCVECPGCRFICCRDCVYRYLLEQPDINPKCMSCKVQWDFEFLANNTDDSFHNKKYREHRAKILITREKSLLPATQPFVVLEQKKTQLNEKMEDLTEKINQIKSILDRLMAKRTKLRKQIREGFQPVKEEKNNSKFIGHCPEKDCKGFLNEKYACGICDKQACKKCRQMQHPGEKCDPNTIETIRLLAKDTKSCPNCMAPIYKISGCSQMFCVTCHTPFDWDTGKIVTGRIHNPHFYEWQKATGGNLREAGDVRCGGVNIVELRKALRKFDPTTIQWILDIHRMIGHIRDEPLVKYRRHDNVGDQSNRDLRIQYLSNKISDTKWLFEIKKREKKREKYRAIYLILTMLTDTMDDLMANIVVSKKIVLKQQFIVQMKELVDYANESFTKIAHRFKNKVPKIYTDPVRFVDVGDKRIHKK